MGHPIEIFGGNRNLAYRLLPVSFCFRDHHLLDVGGSSVPSGCHSSVSQNIERKERSIEPQVSIVWLGRLYSLSLRLPWWRTDLERHPLRVGVFRPTGFVRKAAILLRSPMSRFIRVAW